MDMDTGISIGQILYLVCNLAETIKTRSTDRRFDWRPKSIEKESTFLIWLLSEIFNQNIYHNKCNAFQL